MIVRGDAAAVARFDERALVDVVRVDAFAPPIRIGATPIERTREGFEVFEGTATMGDVVLPYPEHGTVEFRPADEVLAEAACASMVGKPITDSHPAKLLDSTTAAGHVRGAVLSAKRDDTGPVPTMRVRIVVYDEALLAKIRGGKVELSPGYFFRLDRTPGAFKGQRYTAIQRAIIYNHLAVVDDGRTVAPDGTKARLDATSTKGTPNMELVDFTLPDGTTVKIPAAVAALIESLKAEAPAPADGVDADPPADPPADKPAEDQRADADRIVALERQVAELGRRIDGMPAELRAEAVSYADTRGKAEPILAARGVAHRFDGDAFADKFAVAVAVFGSDDDDVKELAAAATGKAKRTPHLEGRMDGIFKSAIREAGRSNVDDQLRGLKPKPKTKGDDTRADGNGGAPVDQVRGLPGFTFKGQGAAAN